MSTHLKKKIVDKNILNLLETTPKKKEEYFSISDDYEILNYNNNNKYSNDVDFSGLEKKIKKKSNLINQRFKNYINRLHPKQEKKLKELYKKCPNNEIEYKKIYNKDYLDYKPNKNIYIQNVIPIDTDIKEENEFLKRKINNFLKGLNKSKVNDIQTEFLKDLVDVLSEEYGERKINIQNYMISQDKLNLKKLLEYFKKRVNRRKKIKWLKKL